MKLLEFLFVNLSVYDKRCTAILKTTKKEERPLKESRRTYIIKNNITHLNYKETLLNSEQMMHKMKTIRSDRHQLGSYEINKVSLSCFDDKRYIHENGKTSYAYGSKDI